MTIQEMHTLCDLLLDKANAPWFNPVEKDVFLNLAQMEFVKTRYSEFEKNEKRREDLTSLVRRQVFTNTKEINLSNITDFLFILSVSGKVNNCGTLSIEEISPVQHDDFVRGQKDPFNKSSLKNVLYVHINNGTSNLIEIQLDDVLEEVTLVYLKSPVKVSLSGNINCEISEHTHEEIVNLAVRKMMMTVQDQNYQVQMNEINNQE